MTWLCHYRGRLYTAILNAIVTTAYRAMAGMDPDNQR